MPASIAKNSSPEKIFIGVSWPYANGNIHVGHLAGQNVVCDVFARYHRLKGNRVLMVSGSDSHGAPVIFKAEELKEEPAQYAAASHERIVDTYQKLGLLYENYTKTTTELHKKVSQNLFLVLKEGGYLKTHSSKQYYDPKVERFLPDRYVRGTCPNCNATNARGDECPECGKYLEPTDLINPYSTLSDATPELKETEHFYLDLRALQPELESWIKANSKHWRKWVREFSLGWIKQGLEERPITRDLDYGVPVPVEGWDHKVMYVWFEAVIGYLSAAIEWAHKQGDPSKWEEFWKDPACKHYYFIAGGNVPFHTIVWPAELVAYNEKYKDEKLKGSYPLPGEKSDIPLNLPFDVPANNMLFYKGKKMSKGDSTGVTVERLYELFGADALRFYVVRNAPESQDKEYTWKEFIETNNNELVANLGNFINRALVFTQSKFDGVVPVGKLDPEVKKEIENGLKSCGGYIEECKFVKSLEAVLKLGAFANKYFNDQAPWESIKSDRAAAENTLYNCIQLVETLRVVLKPYTPFAVHKLGKMLGNGSEIDPNIELEVSGRVESSANVWQFTPIESGRKLNPPEILFPKFELPEGLE